MTPAPKLGMRVEMLSASMEWRPCVVVSVTIEGTQLVRLAEPDGWVSPWLEWQRLTVRAAQR